MAAGRGRASLTACFFLFLRERWRMRLMPPDRIYGKEDEIKERSCKERLMAWISWAGLLSGILFRSWCLESVLKASRILRATCSRVEDWFLTRVCSAREVFSAKFRILLSMFGECLAAEFSKTSEIPKFVRHAAIHRIFGNFVRFQRQVDNATRLGTSRLIEKGCK